MAFLAPLVPAWMAGTAATTTTVALGAEAAWAAGASAATMAGHAVTTAAVPALFTAGDLLIGGAGALGAIASLDAAQATAQAAAFNAAQFDRGADRAKAISDMEANSYRKNQLSRLARARTDMLASGRDMTGTAIRLDDQAVEDIAYEEAIIRAGGHQTAQEYSDAALLKRSEGSYAQRAGLLRAGTTLASAGGRMNRLHSEFFG